MLLTFEPQSIAYDRDGAKWSLPIRALRDSSFGFRSTGATVGQFATSPRAVLASGQPMAPIRLNRWPKPVAGPGDSCNRSRRH